MNDQMRRDGKRLIATISKRIADIDYFMERHRTSLADLEKERDRAVKELEWWKEETQENA